MAGANRTTMAKLNRETRMSERRAAKQMRRDARKNGEIAPVVSDEPESLDHLDRFVPSDFDSDHGLRRVEESSRKD